MSGAKIDPFDPITSLSPELQARAIPTCSLPNLGAFPKFHEVVHQPRPTADIYFLGLAEHASKRATCDRAHVGCVLVRAGSVLATGYNGSIGGMPHCNEWQHPFIGFTCSSCGTDMENEHLPCTAPVDAGVGHLMEDGHCVRTIHAEENALVQAAKHGHATAGCTAYINTYPCWSCFKLMMNAGIKRIVCAKEYRKDPRVAEVAKTLGVEVLVLPLP